MESVRYDKGDQHPDLIEFCQHCTEPDCAGICSAYKAKYREVWNIKTIRDRKRGKRRVKQTYEAFGEAHTIYGWAEKTGIAYDALYHRFNSPHWTLEEALTTPSGARRLITIDGETHTVTEWLGIAGMPRGCYYKRIREGWSAKDALFTPSPGQRRREKNGR